MAPELTLAEIAAEAASDSTTAITTDTDAADAERMAQAKVAALLSDLEAERDAIAGFAFVATEIADLATTDAEAAISRRLPVESCLPVLPDALCRDMTALFDPDAAPETAPLLLGSARSHSHASDWAWAANVGGDHTESVLAANWRRDPFAWP